MDFYSERGSTCTNHAEAIEVALDRLEQVLGVSVSDRRITYHHAASDRVRSVCGSPVTGCTDGINVWSALALHQHELVHVLMAELGRSSPVLEEGIADVFGAAFYGNESLAVPTPELEEWLLGGRPDDIADIYAPSASFVTYIIEEFGLDALLELYTCIPQSASREIVGACTMGVLGQPMDELLGAWMRRGPRPAFEVIYPTLECQSPELPLADWGAVSLECGFGTGNALPDQRTQFRSVDVASRSVALRLRSEDVYRVGLRVEGCGTARPMGLLPPYESPVLDVDRPERLFLWRGDGRYALRPFVRSEGASTCELRADLGNWLSEQCEDAEAFDLGSVSEMVIAGTERVWARMRVPDDTRLRVAVPPDSDLLIELFQDDCGTPYGSLGSGGDLLLEGRHEYLVHVSVAAPGSLIGGIRLILDDV